MTDCKHPWRSIDSKGEGIVECERCHQRWRGEAAEFVWKRAKEGIQELWGRLAKVADMLERDLNILSCDFCGEFFPGSGSKLGLVANGQCLCYECAPAWYDKIASRYNDPDRHYVRMALARWLSRYCYYNPHTAKLYRALEAEITYCLKQDGKLAYVLQ